MFKLESVGIPLTSWLFAIRKPGTNKVLLVLSAIGLVVFADKTFPLINDIIQLKINLLGMFLEPFLQSVFDISLRQAQIVAAWIYLIMGVFIFWYAFKKIYYGLVNVLFKLRQNWLVKNRFEKIGFCVLSLLLTIALAKTFLLFV
jgi:hypothetical protein